MDRNPRFSPFRIVGTVGAFAAAAAVCGLSAATLLLVSELKSHRAAAEMRARSLAEEAATHRTEEARAEAQSIATRTAALKVVRASVETDRATVQDLARETPLFSPRPDMVFELFQLHPNGVTTSLLRVPSSAAPFDPLPQVARLPGEARITVAVPVEPLYGGAPGLVAIARKIAIAAIPAPSPAPTLFAWRLFAVLFGLLAVALVMVRYKRFPFAVGRRAQRGPSPRSNPRLPATTVGAEPSGARAVTQATPVKAQPSAFREPLAVGRDWSKVVGSHYRIFRQLGGEADSPILLALSFQDRRQPEEVAIRVFENVGEKAGRRFVQAARVLADVRHPNLVEIRDCGTGEESCYLVMEYIEGWSLAGLGRELRKTNDRMPLAHILTIGEALCRGLDTLHSAVDPQGRPLRLVHGAVRTQNVIIGCHGTVKLGGCSAANPHALPAPGIAAPEQLRDGASVDGRADVYGVARLLCDLIAPSLETGARAPASAEWAGLDSVLRARPDLPRRLLDALGAALAFEPEERFDSCDRFGCELSAILHRCVSSDEDTTVLSEWAEEVRHLSRVVVSLERRP